MPVVKCLCFLAEKRFLIASTKVPFKMGISSKRETSVKSPANYVWNFNERVRNSSFSSCDKRQTATTWQLMPKKDKIVSIFVWNLLNFFSASKSRLLIAYRKHGARLVLTRLIFFAQNLNMVKNCFFCLCFVGIVAFSVWFLQLTAVTLSWAILLQLRHSTATQFHGCNCILNKWNQIRLKWLQHCNVGKLDGMYSQSRAKIKVPSNQ